MATMTETQYYFLCFLLLFFSTLLLKSFFSKLSKPTTGLHLPPSPQGSLPLIGHLRLLGPSVHISFQNLSKKYGPLLYLRLGFFPCYVVSSFSVAKQIFKTQDVNFASHPNMGFSDKLPYGNYGFFSAPYGNYWRFIKKLTMTELLSPRQLDRSRVVRQEEVARFLHKLLESAEKKEAVDLGFELMKLSNNTLCRMVMSTRCSEKGDEAEKIRQLVNDTFAIGTHILIGDLLGPFGFIAFWLYGKSAMEVTARFDDFLERMLKDHEQNKEREHEDLMDILLKAYKDDKAEVKFTRTHLKALLLDIFIGGTGTTSEAILWTMAELINHPDVLNKLREEINSVVGDTKLVEESDVRNFPYLQAVVKETLRLFPPLPVTSRQCQESCKINGFDITPNTMVAVNMYAIMRDPDIWENPNEFYPERFLVSSKKQDEVLEETFSYTPFGAGRRGCPGKNLAMIILQTTIATMVQCFDWKVGRDGDEAKVSTEVASGPFVHVAHPVICLPVIRFNPLASSV